MILSILAVILVIGIAYFHWVQGLFSAAISMALALLASALAIGMHEWVATSLLGGAMADYANGMIACVIFAAVYGIGRIFFDMFVPGNVSVPFYMDKVGAGVCGLIAGIFSVGTMLLAAQMLPFGTTIAGFSRYTIAESREVNAPGRRGQVDAEVRDALEIEPGQSKPSETARQNLLGGFDTTVLNFVTFQSQNGSLAGDVALNERHPDLIGELYFGRLGVEPAAKRSAMNIAGKKDVEVVALLSATTLPQVDAEIKDMRHPAFNVEKTLKATPNEILLVVRTKVAANASDKDKNFRVSTGAVRLVVNNQTYHPVGTLYHPGNVVLANRIDDYLIIDASADAEVDFVFRVNRADLLQEPQAKEGLKVKEDAFVEVKRYARVDVGGMEVAGTITPPATGDKVRRKTKVVEEEIPKVLGQSVTQ